ncbi:hypothetical protein ACTWLT_17300 [Micromonospora sp. ZYX-F-536]|uniref:hypothetical protein n=1 Tax=Micromonospora sp. ZYX-F-536 TaxID=3457629 RepID=UPI0040407B71
MIRLVAIGVALAAMLAAPTAASAASPAGAEVATTVEEANAAAGMCNIYRGAYRGGMLCGDSYASRDFTHPDGRKETFIIGYDQAMWHIYQRYAGDTQWSGWSSMGGGFNSGVSLWRSSPLIVYGNGLDNRAYCNSLREGLPWTGWYRCPW